MAGANASPGQRRHGLGDHSRGGELGKAAQSVAGSADVDRWMATVNSVVQDGAVMGDDMYEYNLYREAAFYFKEGTKMVNQLRELGMNSSQCVVGRHLAAHVAGSSRGVATRPWEARAVFVKDGGGWTLGSFTKELSEEYRLEGAPQELRVVYQRSDELAWSFASSDTHETWTALATHEGKGLLKHLERWDGEESMIEDDLHDVAELFSPPRIVPAAKSPRSQSGLELRLAHRRSDPIGSEAQCEFTESRAISACTM